MDKQVFWSFILLVVIVFSCCAFTIWVYSHQLEIEMIYNEIQIGQIEGLSKQLSYRR